MRRLALILAIVALAGGARPAAAERLVVSLSNPRVAVTSSFVGEDLVLFGTIEPDAGQTALRPADHLVLTVTGPRETLRTRRKQCVLGIWVNVDLREFVRVPSYLASIQVLPFSGRCHRRRSASETERLPSRRSFCTSLTASAFRTSCDTLTRATLHAESLASRMVSCSAKIGSRFAF